MSSVVTDPRPPFPLPLLGFKRPACTLYGKKSNAHRRAMVSNNTRPHFFIFNNRLQPRCEFITAVLNMR